ncbi:MAG: hypothetical protein MZV64_18965 [Ignavibacteriales bacterium]|nr:hypothetical protein [Ignavibacteriales bacterium]
MKNITSSCNHRAAADKWRRACLSVRRRASWEWRSRSICAENATCGKCMVLIEEGRFEKYNIDSKREHLSPSPSRKRTISSVDPNY